MSDISQQFHELTQPHHLDTPYIELRDNGETWTRRHHVKVPPLLQQLAAATPATDEAGGRAIGSPKSRPAAWLEQLDTLIAIERQAARLLRDLHLDDTGNALVVVRRLYAARPGLTSDSLDLKTIDAHGRNWWQQARILTGHDTSAWRPDNTCPLCAARGTLRIRRDASGALCIDCRETWHHDTIGLLADHIRLENHDEDTANVHPA